MNACKANILPESPILALITLVDCFGEIAPLIRRRLLVILLFLFVGANRSDQIYRSLR